MYPTSARWGDRVRSSGEAVARVEVWRRGVHQGVTLPVSTGSVRLDESSNVRRTLTLSIGDPSLMPTGVADLLSPRDTDLKVWAGVRYQEGDEELVPLGVFRLVTPARPSLRSAEVTLAARDHSDTLARARFPRPFNVARGSRVTNVIAARIGPTV